MTLICTFRPDPTVKLLRPTKSTVSGGLTVQVHGDKFDLIQRTGLLLTYRGVDYQGPPCNVTSDQLMLCKSPDLRAKRDQGPKRIIHGNRATEYGVLLDGVKTWR